MESIRRLNSANEDLVAIAENALNGVDNSIEYLVILWEEPWEFIKDKLMNEGSQWYCWWMDGVNQHLVNTVKSEAHNAIR